MAFLAVFFPRPDIDYSQSSLFGSISVAGFLNAGIISEFAISMTATVLMVPVGLGINLGAFYLGKMICGKEEKK